MSSEDYVRPASSGVGAGRAAVKTTGTDIIGDGRSPRQIGTGGAFAVRLREKDFETDQAPLPAFTLSILLAGRSRPWRDIGDGLRIPQGAEEFRHRGGAILTPHATAVRWRVEGAHDCLVLGFPLDGSDKVLAGLGPGDTGALYRLTDRVVHDPLFPVLARQLWEQGANSRDAFFADHAVALILAQLSRHANGLEVHTPVVREQLAPHVLRRVQDYLDANMSGEVSLNEVAAVAGLSPYHFLRAFKGSTGITPFRWIEQRRIEAALRMLATDMPLAELALELGFKSQSHFTAVFKRRVGESPARWRRHPGG